VKDSSERLVLFVTDASLRIDKFLSSHPQISSRSRAAKLISMGCVTLASGKQIEKASEKLDVATKVIVQLPTLPKEEIEPLDMDLEIVYEDADLLVVNKPAGLVVHPAAGHASDTLVNALVHKVKDLSMGFEEKRPGIVHRLDKDTSGLLVVAKNDKTQQGLVAQFKAKTVHRVYEALVFGSFGEPKTFESFLIRHPVDRKRYCSERIEESVPSKGKFAVTHAVPVKQYAQGLSLIECQLETGRTHQIRIHCSESGYAIIGDQLYGSDRRLKNLKSTQLQSEIRKLNRIGLHARDLGFVHPISGKEIQLTKAWPEDMKPVFKRLKP